MSLVNEMLQDLQQRKAAGSRPLAGLHAVPTGSRADEPAQRKPWWIAAVFVMAVVAGAILWSGFEPHTGLRQTPVTTASADAEPAPVVQPAAAVPDTTVAATGKADPAIYADLETNRLDYFLRSPPSPKKQVPAVARTTAPAISVPRSSDFDSRSDSVANDESRMVFKKPVSDESRLRRDGLAALREGKAIAAEKQFDKLVATDPANPESHLFLHAALKAQSRSGAARAVLLSGLDRTSDPAQLAQVLSSELLAEGRVNHALAVLTQHRPPDRLDLNYEARLAAINQRAGNHDVAAEIYGLLVARQPAKDVWWVGLAISQEATGQVSDARKSFATAAAGGTLDATLARYAAERLERLEAGS